MSYMNGGDPLDAVFQALGSAVRRRILDVVKNQPGCSVNDVCAYFDTSRIAVMKHLGFLENAGLITSEKVGRTRRLYHNTVPIQMIYDRWTTDYSAIWAGKLTRLKYKIEEALETSAPASRKKGKDRAKSRKKGQGKKGKKDG